GRLAEMARWTLQSPPMREAAASGRFWFELDMTAPAEGPTFLVGRADAAFLDQEGRVCVIDFKSDRSLSAHSVEHYGAQVRAYRDVLSAATGLAPGRAILLFAAPEVRQVLEV
ncbi:MAG: PD-(D/E)XK nuclease family protein, partial [Brachybacterium sp.]|nr:PD-(D/E)XK nuclease family protein [Brachybacterium sp.]